MKEASILGLAIIMASLIISSAISNQPKHKAEYLARILVECEEASSLGDPACVKYAVLVDK